MIACIILLLVGFAVNTLTLFILLRRMARAEAWQLAQITGLHEPARTKILQTPPLRIEDI